MDRPQNNTSNQRPLQRLSSSDTGILLVQAPLLGLDLEAALLGMGVRTLTSSASGIGLEFLESVRERGFGAVLSINHSPELALLCSLAGLRYLSWTIDPIGHRRWSLLGGTNPETTRLFVHRKALLAPLRAMGHRHVAWLPLACASRRFSQEASVDPGNPPPLFVGSSLQDERRILTQGCTGWGIAPAIEGIDAILRTLAKSCLWDRSFPGFLQMPSAIPGSLKSLLPKVDPLDLAEVLDAGLAWHFRREMVSILVGHGTQVRGDDGWREVARDQWTGPLRNGQEMTIAYAQAAVNFDVPRVHQREIATLRAFDVMGSGGLLACEAGTELDELFRPGEDFLTWKDERGLLEIFAAVSRRDPALDRVAANGSRSIREGHSLEDRIGQILSAAFQALD